MWPIITGTFLTVVITLLAIRATVRVVKEEQCGVGAPWCPCTKMYGHGGDHQCAEGLTWIP